tara:strand:- start:11439 stop:12278 length:840 start_codon:yes stop_codon:yes gene_type:complete
MSIRGNSGFFNKNKRFGTNTKDIEGGISREQHYLERLNDRLAPGDGGGGSGDYTPSLHYDANEEVTDVSGNIISWGDKITGLLAISSEFPDSPVLISSNTLFNNNPTIRFDEQVLIANDSSVLDSVGGMTVYFVFKYTPGGPGFGLNTVLARTNGTTWNQGWGVQMYDGDVKFWLNNWNTEPSNVRLNLPLSGLANIYKFHYNENNIECEIIGPDSDSGTKSYSTPIVHPDEGLEIGSSGSPSYTTNGDMGEILFFNTPLNNTQQSDVENDLKIKYNIN